MGLPSASVTVTSFWKWSPVSPSSMTCWRNASSSPAVSIRVREICAVWNSVRALASFFSNRASRV